MLSNENLRGLTVVDPRQELGEDLVNSRSTLHVFIGNTCQSRDDFRDRAQWVHHRLESRKYLATADFKRTNFGDLVIVVKPRRLKINDNVRRISERQPADYGRCAVAYLTCLAQIGAHLCNDIRTPVR